MDNFMNGRPDFSNNEALQREISKKLTVGNILRGIGIVAVTTLGVLNLVVQLQNVNATKDLNEDINDIQETAEDIQKTVESIASDVYDIMEQGCEGNNITVLDPRTTAYKPVLYIYDNEPGRQVHTSLTIHNAEMLYMWPEAGKNDGKEYIWDMTTSADGTLFDNAGNEYSYIFWEAAGYDDYKFDQGFCVKGSDTAEFLRDKLEEIGLTPEEYNEFIVYWMPKMQNNEYNLITFEGLDPNDEYNKQYELSVTDGENDLVDSQLRVFMVWQAADEYQEIEPQEFETFERNGFTVVEWGGTEVK